MSRLQPTAHGSGRFRRVSLYALPSAYVNADVAASDYTIEDRCGERLDVSRGSGRHQQRKRWLPAHGSEECRKFPVHCGEHDQLP